MSYLSCFHKYLCNSITSSENDPKSHLKSFVTLPISKVICNTFAGVQVLKKAFKCSTDDIAIIKCMYIILTLGLFTKQILLKHFRHIIYRRHFKNYGTSLTYIDTVYLTSKHNAICLSVCLPSCLH